MAFVYFKYKATYLLKEDSGGGDQENNSLQVDAL